MKTFLLFLSMAATALAAPQLVVRGPDGAVLAEGAMLDFGTLDTGATPSFQLKLSNEGDAALTGLTLALEGPDALRFTLAPPTTAELAPAASTTADLAWVVRSAGKVSATLRIGSAAGSLSLKIAGEGTELASRMEITEAGTSDALQSQSVVDWGSVTVGSAKKKAFRVKNISTAPLQIDGGWVDYYWGDWPYYVVRPAVIWPQGFRVLADALRGRTLAPGESAEFEVQFSPYNTSTVSPVVSLSARTLTNSYFNQSFRVKGTGAPYQPVPLVLNGLHYRMGEGLQNRAIIGWTNSIPGSPIHGLGSTSMGPVFRPYPLLNSWEPWLGDSGSVSLQAVQGADNTWPSFDAVSDSSSTTTVGSTSATTFAQGAYFTGAIRMAASDNVGLELWVRPDSLADGQCIAFVGNAGPDAGFGLYVQGGRIEGRVGSARLLSEPVLAGEWHHVSLILQNGEATLRVDGSVAGTPLPASLPELVTGLGLGALSTGGDPFTGAVDELRLFEVAPGGFLPESHLLATAKPQSENSATALDFGEQLIGQTKLQNVTLINRGPGWLATDLEIVGTDAADFAVTRQYPQPIGQDSWLYGDWGFIYPVRLVISSPFYLTPNNDRSLQPELLQTLSVQVKPGATGLRTATLRVTTNDPEHPVYEIALSAQVLPDRPVIVVSEKPVDLGRVLTNSHSYPSLGIDNTGTAPLEITLSVRGPHAEDFISPAAPVQITVPAGQRIYQPLDYQPQGLGGRRAVLHLATNDPDRPEIDIPFYSEGEQPIPDLRVMNQKTWSEIAKDSMIDLGAVLMNGHESRIDLHLSNVGTDELTGVKVSVEGEHAADFEFTGTVPETLKRSGWWPSEINAMVRFVPLAAGPRTAVLRIESNDPDENPFFITLRGEGKPAAPRLEFSDGGQAVPAGQGFIRFGNAILGGTPSQRTHSLRVRNTGTAPLTSLRARFTGANADSFRAEMPQRIEVGAESDLVLTFAPRRIGPQAAVLHVTSSEADFEQTLTVGGTGAHGLISSLRPTGSVPGWVGTALLELPNGHVLMAGHTTDAEVSTAWLRDIGPDGRETALAPRFHGTIRALALQSDGSLIVAGNFTSVSTEGQSHLVQVGCARLQPDFQTVDTAFQPPAGEFQMGAMVVLPDGKILLGGDGKIGGRAHLVRLNTDGTLDETFTLTAPDAAVQALALQPDGKVVVGGKFTNLEAPWTDLVDGLITIWPAGRRDGLCRLNADGSLDTSFANREFTEVTALAVRDGVIAVGGIQEVAVFWAYISHGVAASNASITNQVHVAGTAVDSSVGASSLMIDQTILPMPPNPSYWMQNQAALLRTDGTALLSHSCIHEPTAVALLPGHRLLLAPGVSGSYGYVDAQSPTVVLLRPNDQPVEHYGVKTSPQPDFGSYPTWTMVPTHVQSLDGAVNALLPMSDGKLLVAGAFAHAETKVIEGWNYLVAQPSPPLPEFSLPNSAPATPVQGFAQLDLDGFFHTPIAAPALDDGTLASDGLTTLEFQSRNMRQVSFSLPGDKALNLKMEIIGDHPEAFSVTRDVVAPTRKGEASTGSDDPVSVVLTFTGIPQGSTPLRAQFRMSRPVFGADGSLTYDEAGAFEIGLVTQGDAALPAQLLIVDPMGAGEIASGATVDFGTINEGKEEWRTLLLFNNGSAPITRPLTMTITGDSAADFAITQTPAYPLATNANAKFTLTFKPQADGPALRTAMLNISDGSTAFPFVIQLQGSVQGVPVISTQPVDTLVFKDQPLTLSAEVLSTGPVNWQWFKDGKRVPGARSASLTIPQSSAEDAGRYFARVRSSAGNVTTETARVGVVTEPPEQQVQRKKGDTLKLTIEATGPGLRYRWFTYDPDTRLPVMLSNNAHIAGASSAQLTLKKLHSGLSGPYACAITLGEATVTTPVTTLEVLPTPQITKGISFTDISMLSPVVDQLEADAWPVRFFARQLPPGLALNRDTGEITGLPRKAGQYRVGIWVVGDGGSSPVMEHLITVRPLAAGLAGTYTGWLERGVHNDGLGGQWSLTIAANGTFTARVRHGRSASASTRRSDVLGKVVTLSYTGTLQVYQEGDVCVATQDVTSTDGLTSASFVARVEGDYRHAQVTHITETGIVGGEADQQVKKLAAHLAKRYRGHLYDGEFGQPVTLLAGRDGSVAWTVRLGTEAPFTVLSGSTQATKGMTTFWSLVPDTEGGRALDGSLYFDNAPPWCYLSVEWGRRVSYDDWSTSRIYSIELIPDRSTSRQ